MKVTQPMVDHIPAAVVPVPELWHIWDGCLRVWSGTVWSDTSAKCVNRTIGPSMAAVRSWQGKVRAK